MMNETKIIDERLNKLDKELDIVGIRGRDRIKIKKILTTQIVEIYREILEMGIKSNKPQEGIIDARD